VINLSIFVEFASCNLNFNDIHWCNTAPR
jgi:organic radical activating enzyme